MATEVLRYVKAVQYDDVTKCLADFRRTVEREYGGEIQRLEVNAALFLDDVAVFMGLSVKQRLEMLGKPAFEAVEAVKGERPKIA